MKNSALALLTALGVVCVVATWVEAQRRDLSNLPPGVKPKVPLVIAVGCANHASDGSWMLINATQGQVSAIMHADPVEREDAKKLPLGANRYRLIGTAEFASVDELLKQGQRSQFTTKETANTNGQLQDGHKIGVKALLIEGPNERRLNLVSVWSIADTCK